MNIVLPGAGGSFFVDRYILIPELEWPESQ